MLAAAAVWLVRVPSLPVRHVVFTEALPHTKRGEVEQVLPAALKGNFFSLNLDMVRSALEKLPWVRKVDVRRQWPDRLEVRVEEHKPVARWGEGRGELVNSYGEVFAASLPEQEAGGMPLLFGPLGTAPEVLKEYGELVGAFKAVGETPVQVTLSPRLAWPLKLTERHVGRYRPRAAEVAGWLCDWRGLSRCIRKWSPNGRSGRLWWICGIRMASRCGVAAEGKGK